MKSQSLKLFAIAFVLGLVTIFASASSANAQEVMSFETQFDFHVGKEKLAAGKYELQRLNYGRFLLRNVGTNDKTFIVSNLTADETSVSTEKIVFNRYGETYFLREIYANRLSAGIKTSESNYEKEIRQENAENEENLAEKNQKPKQVSVNLAK